MDLEEIDDRIKEVERKLSALKLLSNMSLSDDPYDYDMKFQLEDELEELFRAKSQLE